MKKELKGFVFGVVSSVVVMSGVGLAAGFSQMIEVYPNNVTVALRGNLTDIPSFTYNDKTYVELRRVLEGIDCGVEYDPVNKVVNAYNAYMVMSPAYIPETGQIYDLITWSSPLMESDVIRGYVAVEATYRDIKITLK